MIEKKQFLGIIDATPLVSIDLILEDENNKIMLGKRANRPAQGCWFVPGGRIRKNETIKDAFSRIIFNELGLEFSFDHAVLHGVYDHIYDDNCYGAKGINTHYVVLAYKVSIDGSVSVVLDNQHTEIKYMSIESLLSAKDVHQNTKNYFQE